MNTPKTPKGWRRLKAGEIRRATDKAWTFVFGAETEADCACAWRLPDGYDMEYVGKPISGDGLDFKVIRKIATKKKPTATKRKPAKKKK